MSESAGIARGNAAQLIANTAQMWDDKCAPERRANAARDDLPHPTRPEGPLPIMMPDPAREQPQSGNERADAAATIRRLQNLLALAIEARDELLRRGMDTLPEVDKHWFVPEAPDGYHCAACNLPERNGRHVSRRAA